MKKTMSVLLMSFIGMVGTYAWAGSAREDSVARLQSSVDVLHAVMATPDKGIPEEVLSNAKCILVVPVRIRLGWCRKLGIANRSPRCGPGYAGHERPGFPTFALQQVSTERRRI